MPQTLAFDVYGTLIDPNGVVATLRTALGDRAQAVSDTWRQKQLEYAFRRGLMRRYASFAVCTDDALRYACEVHGVELTDEQRSRVLQTYRSLPAFDDVQEALPELEAGGHRLFAFSNGTADAVEGLLEGAGIRSRFAGTVSVDAVQSFKPDPAVYAHFLSVTGARAEEAWLISGNPFDVIGARAAGMHGAWVKRSANAVFDPWGIEPTVTVTGLGQLAAALRTVRT